MDDMQDLPELTVEDLAYFQAKMERATYKESRKVYEAQLEYVQKQITQGDTEK